MEINKKEEDDEISYFDKINFIVENFNYRMNFM
jgi:hypothetical protein